MWSTWLRKPEAFTLLGILGLAVSLRFYGLAWNPGIYTDEGCNLELAWNLARGESRFEALNFYWTTRAPLFYLAQAPLQLLAGQPSLFSLLLQRGFTCGLGLLMVAAVYFTAGRLYRGWLPAFLAGLLMAGFLFEVQYERFGFGDYVLAGVLLSWMGYMVSVNRLGWASVLAGLACLANYYAVIPVLAFTVAQVFHGEGWDRLRKAFTLISPTLIVFSTLLIIMVTRYGDSYAGEVFFMIRRTSNMGEPPLVNLQEATEFFKNLARFYVQAPFLTFPVTLTAGWLVFKGETRQVKTFGLAFLLSQPLILKLMVVTLDGTYKLAVYYWMFPLILAGAVPKFKTCRFKGKPA
ncbi:TPA: hypothetical protein EYP27_02540, partial [Candidatus Bathyarchaeota archaeon]|nr:hypothetical protein [Candidatus Bathyarchaeota archaeon]